MVDIFTKKTGPRREDVEAKRVIGNNWQTISRLADQISDGGYTRSRNAIAKSKELPKPDNLNIHLLGAESRNVEPKPTVRISINGRVVVMDARSGKQLQYLGNIKHRGQIKYFSLATRENSPYATVDKETECTLTDLDGVIIESEEIQELFVRALQERLLSESAKGS